MTPEDVVTFIGVMMWRLTPINDTREGDDVEDDTDQ